MRYIHVLVALTVPALWACRVDTQQVLMDQATKRLQCPSPQIETEDFGDGGTKLARGCGQEVMYTWLNGWVEMQDLQSRASFDLSCEKSELQLTPLSGGTTVGVSGCGKKATYVYTGVSKSGASIQYEWVMDSTS